MPKKSTSSKSRAEYPRDSSALSELDQVHSNDTDTIGEEGIDYHQRGQTISIEDLFHQFLSMKWSLKDVITVIDETEEKPREETKIEDLGLSSPKIGPDLEK